VGGVCALEFESFLGPVKWQRADSKKGWTARSRDWTLALAVSSERQDSEQERLDFEQQRLDTGFGSE
jgi:hypothetical protein